jgi:DNA polymerase-3 subunit alpha
MKILQVLGGFSLGQADMVRRGIASGKRELVEEQRQPFMEGVKRVQLENKQETSEDEMDDLLVLASHIFDLMAFWSEYGFNKAHSVGYGFLTLRGAWLKANYKIHFMAALLSANSKDEDKVIKYIDEIRSRGINVLQPKMNKSLKGFTVSDKDILFGLQAIKGVGPAAVEKIIAGYPYNSTFEFITKVGNRTILPPLIKAGYFEEDKRFLLKYWEAILSMKDGKSKLEENILNELSDKGLHGVTQVEIEKKIENLIYQKSLKKRTEKTRNECLNLIHKEEYADIELLHMEKDTLGLFLSESPLDKYKDLILSNTTLNNEIKLHKVNDEFYIVGMIVETPPVRYDKNNRAMCFLKLQMFDGILELPVFSQVYEKYGDRLIGGEIIISYAKKIRGGITLGRVANLVEKELEFNQFFGMETD